MSKAMNPVFKTLVLTMAGTILVYYGVGAILANEWVVETSRSVTAPPAKVAAVLGDFATWKDWSQMDANLGPETQREVSGAPGTVGHAITWRGGQGLARLQLVEVTPASIRYEFTRQLPGEQELLLSGRGQVSWVPEGTGSKVTWRDEGKWDSMPGRWIGWFGALQERMRQIQNSSLEGLERAAAR
ncbi:MAG: SRPBCC family protein [Planctomycetes bacterium]|nr:SRPBCC family protein [Planctomycetota bacterium]